MYGFAILGFLSVPLLAILVRSDGLLVAWLGGVLLILVAAI